MKSIITEEMIKIKHEEFKFFELAYCITVHCSQGDTIKEPYSIYECVESHYEKSCKFLSYRL